MKLLKRLLSWEVLLVLLIILLAYGQTLLMYFWQDDSALIFKLMNPEGPAGSFGYGVIGDGPYKYLVTFFVPFFPIFGKEPFGYFFIGLVTYAFATWAFYFFSKQLLEEKRSALLTTLVFAAGYVGGDTMFRVINSWQTNIGLTLALITFGYYIRYLKTNTFKIYLASVALFFLTTEIVFIRSHSLVFAIMLFDIIFRAIPFNARRIPGMIIRWIPFVFIFYWYYMTDASFGTTGASFIFTELFRNGNISIVSSYFANLGNVLVPNVLQSFVANYATKILFSTETLTYQMKAMIALVFAGCVVIALLVKRAYSLSKRSLVYVLVILLGALVLNNSFIQTSPLWYRDLQSVVAGALGLSLPVLVIYFSVALWKTEKLFSRGILLGLFLAASQFSAYYIQYSDSVFPTHHRYYSHSFMGFSVLWGSLLFLWWKKNQKRGLYISLTPTVVLLSGILFLNITYQHDLVLDRGKPTRAFYSDLLSYVPHIEKGAAFYFDIAQNPRAGTQFSDFFSVGSMPESTALGMYYDVDRYEVYYITDYNELLYKLKTGEVKIDNLYSFYVPGYDYRTTDGGVGLIETTSQMRELLTSSGTLHVDKIGKQVETKYKKDSDGVTSSPKALEVKVEVPALTSQLVTFNATFSVQSIPSLLPYRSQSADATDSISVLKALEYLNARQEYYQNAEIMSTSDWKYREIRYINDQDYETPWQGHRIWWHEKRIEDVTIDLGSTKNINRLIWRNWKVTLAPNSYDIQLSDDGRDWITVKSVVDGPERADGEIVIDSFEPHDAQYVRMHITKTSAEDSPAIKELEVVETKYSDVDTVKALTLSSNPFSYVQTPDEWKSIAETYQNQAQMYVTWKSNKSSSFSHPAIVPIILDGLTHRYEIVIPAGGTQIEAVQFIFDFPVKGNISEIRYTNLDLTSMNERGLIQEVSEN